MVKRIMVDQMVMIDQQLVVLPKQTEMKKIVIKQKQMVKIMGEQVVR